MSCDINIKSVPCTNPLIYLLNVKWRNSNLLSHFFHRLNAGAIEIVVKLSGLNEQVVLYVLFHLFAGRHEVIVAAILLILTPRSCCVYNVIPYLVSTTWYHTYLYAITNTYSISVRYIYYYNTKYQTTRCGKIRPHCAKCIIVPVVLNFPAKSSGTVPGIIYRLQY